MTRCWEAEPTERPTFVQIYELLHNMLIDNEVIKKLSLSDNYIFEIYYFGLIILLPLLGNTNPRYDNFIQIIPTIKATSYPGHFTFRVGENDPRLGRSHDTLTFGHV